MDIKLFINTDSPSLIKDYRKYIGSHAVPPFWAFGNNLYRYIYKNLDHIEKVMEEYEKQKILLDTYQVDINYHDTFYMFANNQQKFNRKKFRAMIKK